MQRTFRARTLRIPKNIQRIRQTGAGSLETSTSRRSQQLGTYRTLLSIILTEYAHLRPYKIQLLQELQSRVHEHSRQYNNAQ